jgi:hypothetical protein
LPFYRGADSGIVGIIGYREGSKKHLDDPVPSGDFQVLHCLGIVLSVSGIVSDHIRKYASKIYFERHPDLNPQSYSF